MRQILFLIILFLQFGTAELFSQNVAIENLKQNIAYPYLDNPMNIIVEGIPCEEIFVSTDNGEVKSKRNCQYIFHPHEVGVASIFIHMIEKGDTIQIKERKYRVKRWPKPVASLSGNKSGKLGIGEFKAQLGISARIENFDIDARCKVISFELQIIRGKNLIREVINNGGRFEEKTKKIIFKVEKGDRIILDKIMVLMPGSKDKIELDDIDIIIK
ncbi:MAG: GldM family protein [Saprospiraceae bacterium]